MQGALYFPLIDVPESPWLYRALLYWDIVGTIVPRSWPMTPEEFSPHTLELVRAELVRQVFPADAAPSMATRYEHWLSELDPDVVTERRRKFRAGLSRRIHYDKWLAMGSGLSIAEGLGLARVSGRYDWLEVEERTAAEFMAALALALCHPTSGLVERGNSTGTAWVPASDQPSAVEAVLTGLRAMEPGDSSDTELRLRVRGEIRAAEIRAVVLDKCLPVPATPISVETLLDFRQRHQDALPKFRRYLERQVDTTLLIEDAELRLRAVDRIVDEVEELTAQVEAYLRESGLRRIKRSRLLRLLKFVPGLSGPVDAAREVAAALETSTDVTTEPLAYLAFARSELHLASTYLAAHAEPLVATFDD